MAVFNISTNSAVVGTVVARQAVTYLKGFLGISKYRNMKFQADLPENKTVAVPVLSTITASEKTAGSTFSNTTSTISTVSVTLEKHLYVNPVIEDTLAITTRFSIEEQLGRAMASSIVSALDTYVASTIQAGVGWTYGTYNTAMTVSGVSYCIENMKNNLMLPNMPMVLAITAKGERDLRNDGDYKTFYNYGNNQVVSAGNLPPIYGVDVNMFNNLPVSGNNHSGLFWTPEAVALVGATLPMENIAGVNFYTYTDPDTQLGIRVAEYYDNTYGGRAWRPELFVGCKVLMSGLVGEYKH
jgi:hypothetical protein